MTKVTKDRIMRKKKIWDMIMMKSATLRKAPLSIEYIIIIQIII